MDLSDQRDRKTARRLRGDLCLFPQRVDTTAPESLKGNLTAMGWVITPEGIGNLVKRVHRDWPEIEEIVITENGAAFDDEVVDGSVIDKKRTAYLKDHLASLSSAIASGVPVTGYFAWSLLDNFEWAEGYAKRFGLVYVDFNTQRRILKLSARTYRDIIAENR